MTITVGIRDITRNIDILREYGYVDIEDKKTKEYKGAFLSPEYAQEFKEYLASKKELAKAKLKQYAGKGKIDSKYDGLSSSELRSAVALENSGE